MVRSCGVYAVPDMLVAALKVVEREDSEGS